MYVFKSLTNNDIITSDKEMNYHYDFNGNDFSNDDILIDRIKAEYNTNYYNSIKHLYYSNYLNGVGGQVSKTNLIEYNLDGTTGGESYTPSFDNFLSTTLNPKRIWPKDQSSIGIISIPKRLFGDHIKPHSVLIQSQNITISDNGDGVLNIHKGDKRLPVGVIIYEHGILIFTPINNAPEDPTDDILSYYGYGEYGKSKYGEERTINGGSYSFTEDDLNEILNTNINLKFFNSYTFQESLYKCTIEHNEFNTSNNPTLKDNKEDGIMKDFIKESTFNPYISTIGLYNENYELMAVAKLANPLPTSDINDMNIVIKLDRL